MVNKYCTNTTKYLLLFLISIINIFCSSNELKSKDSPSEKYNTTIIIHYKTESDRQFTKFQQYDLFYLRDYNIIDPPPHQLKTGKLVTTIALHLEKPELLLLGFNELYIEPNTILDVSYSLIKESKTKFEDTIRINSGKGFIIKKHSGSLFYNKVFINKVDDITNNKKADQILSKNILEKESQAAVDKIYASSPYLQKTAEVDNFIRQYDIQNNFLELILAYKRSSHLRSRDLQCYMNNKFKELSEALSKSLIIKTRKYWISMQKLYEQILDNKFKKHQYSYRAIEDEIHNYDGITQQYILLLAIKNNYHLSNQQNDIESLLDKITFVAFKPYLKNYQNRTESGSLLDEEIKNSILYDYELQPVYFSGLFKNSYQEYVYLDFAGSWCTPCIKEMAEYVENKKYDNSKLLKPYWLFFENNKTDWLKVVDKLGLKKENCFLVLNNQEFTNYFTTHFHWQAEFPHHFLLNNKGHLINANAVSLTEINISVKTIQPSVQRR